MKDAQNTSAEKYKYQNASSRRKNAIIFLLIAMAFSLFSIIFSFYEWGIYHQYDEGATLEVLTDGELAMVSIGVLLIHLPRTAFFILSAVFVLLWLYRIHQNARALTIEGTIYAPGWAVAFYFIPLVNFVLPLISMYHLYRNHYRTAEAHNLDAEPERKWMVVVWWLAFVFSALVMSPAALNTEEETIGLILIDVQTTIVSELVLIISGIFFILIIRRLTTIQERLAEKLKISST
ncbi:DUF4328 domain-containing protein [Salsuginibacillus kocurii]|uniref:DUF4328 domain-containing protein n=1 Tax=Salsuginibacillus kocurii TaxID=427078 RepID=UPI0003649B99|nr:DUF4328 domain-containing protein [Salsuginibacillus kocurii]